MNDQHGKDSLSRREIGREQERRKARVKKRRRQKRVRLLLGILLVLSLCFGAFQIGKTLMAHKKPSSTTGETVAVTIPEGASTQKIGEILKEKGLIQNVLFFRLKSKINGFDGTYHQGDYQIDAALSDGEIMKVLQTGVVLEGLKLVVPEGYTVMKIAQRLEEMGMFSAESFVKEVNEGVFDYDFLKDLPQRTYRLEGYLFPDTYYLKEGITPHEVIEKMLSRFSEVYQETTIQEKLKESTHSFDELITIASMIEAEIRVPEERKTAAGVINNRLKEGMPLQLDATVLYAMGIVKEDVLYADLKIDSPYNTYQVKGLPLGPIGNPGKASIEAALDPEENNYLYYVLEAKGKFNHVYTQTYEEFLAAKEKYKASKDTTTTNQ